MACSTATDTETYLYDGARGVFQDSCRKNHAAVFKFSRVALSGLRVTAPTGSQFRMSLDQRSGCLALAAA